jgi:uncharacterized protein
MRVQRYTDLAAFSARVWPFLVASEAAHCLQLGILNGLASHPENYGAEPYMACVEDERGDIALVALRTPPHNLILSLPAPDTELSSAITALLSDVRAVTDNLRGVIGPYEPASRFATEWGDSLEMNVMAGIRERIYQLARVPPLQPAPGAMRHIEERDRELLRAWLKEFLLEALGEHVPTADGMIDSRLRGGGSGMYLWEDGEPVSLAGYGGPTPHGIRIGPVYTPPEARGRGYASALVAQMSQRLLDEGREFCFLFTDLTNRTSNHIYQEIGYEPVGDAAEYRFANQPAEN